ncbi:hypothetical protein [Natronosalvus caseinilyticus]|uniref:hypothetical protein n=1 Tax=Natronosalvus caseinilyticus TaxID=2953747 RepID=UPI0028AC96F3|nr:hypothetical protein [Natronosalvus caseinilyticus]
MNRRAFIGAAVGGSALLAGCTQLLSGETPSRSVGEPDGDGDGNGDIGENDDADGDGGENGDGDGPGFPNETVTVVDFETARLTAAVVGGRLTTDDRLAARIDFLEPATPDSPARLRAEVTNNQPYEQTFAARRLVVLDDPPVGQSSDRNAIYLAPVEGHPLAESIPGYARDENGRWRLEDVRDDWFPDTLTLEAEETVTGVYHLLGHHLADEPSIRAGRYRFGWREGGFEVAVWSTDEPGPDRASQFAGESVADLPDAETIRWYHEATPTTEASLEPDTERIEAPGKLEFTLVNHSREAMGGNPYQWRLYKSVDGEWLPVYPWAWNAPYATRGPGAVDETTLQCYHGDPVPCEGSRTVGHLGGGRYAYSVGYSLDEETHAAMFDLEAPDLDVGLEADADVEDGWEEAVVTLPNYADARKPATFTVTRVDAKAEDRLIPEQLPRRPFRAFRNALPLFFDEDRDGIERVRVRTDRGTALGPFGYEEGEVRTVEFDGRTFEARGQLEDA